MITCTLTTDANQQSVFVMDTGGAGQKFEIKWTPDAVQSLRDDLGISMQEYVEGIARQYLTTLNMPADVLEEARTQIQLTFTKETS